MRPGVLLYALTLSATCVAATPTHWSTGQVLCNIADTRITEASGIAMSRRNPGVFFVHNDSGDSARFFAIDKQGRTVATINVGNASATDWEDIAAGYDAGGVAAVYLGDIGDNESARAECTIYAVADPLLNVHKLGQTLAATARVLRYTYPDGPHDAESLMVDPRTHALYVVTKERKNVPTDVFRLDPVWDGPAQTARLVGKLRFSDAGPIYANLATGSDISPDGSRLIIRTYWQAYEWTIARRETPEAALKRKPVIVPIALERQGEGICYGLDGKTLLTTSEKKPTPVFIYKWKDKP